MSLYNRMIEHLIIPLGDLALGTAFMPQLREWRKIGSSAPDAIAALQKNRLEALLDHSVRNLPFYKKAAGPKNEDPFKWIRSFPVLHKKDIRDHLDELIFGDRSGLISERSSGSSGIQGEVFMTRQENMNVIATQTYLWEWAGYQLGAPLLQLGMTTKRSALKAWKDKVLRTQYQQAFDLDQNTVQEAFQQVPRKGAFFGGYASGLYAYAKLAQELGITDIQFDAVISWGDKMFPHYRQIIERQFKTRVFDTYGCTEGLMIAGQCEAGNYHVLTPHVYLELLDKNGNEVQPGELGYVVATRLDAYAMPLIRYYLGDLAVAEEPKKRCPCGRPFPMIKQIIGRDTDIVRTASGKHLIVHFFTGIFEHIPEIRQFRVIQNTLDEIILEYIPNRDDFNPEILKKIHHTIEEKLNEPIRISFNEVDLIPATPSGKPQIIQSLIG